MGLHAFGVLGFSFLGEGFWNPMLNKPLSRKKDYNFLPLITLLRIQERLQFPAINNALEDRGHIDKGSWIYDDL